MVLLLTYQKKDPEPNDIIKWPNSKVANALGLMTSMVKVAVDAFKTFHDPDLTHLIKELSFYKKEKTKVIGSCGLP
jgi:hypothetical protein